MINKQEYVQNKKTIKALKDILKAHCAVFAEFEEQRSEHINAIEGIIEDLQDDVEDYELRVMIMDAMWK